MADVDVDSGKQLMVEDGRWAADQLAVFQQRANWESIAMTMCR